MSTMTGQYLRSTADAPQRCTSGAGTEQTYRDRGRELPGRLRGGQRHGSVDRVLSGQRRGDGGEHAR